MPRPQEGGFAKFVEARKAKQTAAEKAKRAAVVAAARKYANRPREKDGGAADTLGT